VLLLLPLVLTQLVLLLGSPLRRRSCCSLRAGIC
jgi:hypothetical protein